MPVSVSEAIGVLQPKVKPLTVSAPPVSIEPQKCHPLNMAMTLFSSRRQSRAQQGHFSRHDKELILFHPAPPTAFVTRRSHPCKMARRHEMKGPVLVME